MVIAPTWRAVFDPLNHLTMTNWRDGREYRGIVPVALSRADVNAWVEWAALVDAGRTSAIGTGIRRSLSALRERNDDADALVDVVIAWENLFGGDIELSFRISMALARLLEAETDARPALQKEIARLYGVRSKIVHGDAVDPTKLGEVARRARTLTLDMWRALFRDEPPLLTSNDRARALLLR